MNPIIRNILAVLAGVVIGSIVNMALIMISGSIIPPPIGAADVSTEEGLKASIHLFEPKHFIFPFLAHALGTLVGALVTALAAATHKKRLAIGVSVFFLIGGISTLFMIPSPAWFSVLDLVVAYLPMGYLGWKLAGGKK
jgi:hypothetical protein